MLVLTVLVGSAPQLGAQSVTSGDIVGVVTDAEEGYYNG
jgi:hypothetical protein